MDRFSRRGEGGAALIFAMALIVVLLIAGMALIQYAGADRVVSARKSAEARSLSCAEAGIQFGRRFFGCIYKDTKNWNDLLAYNAALGANRTAVTGKLDGSSPGQDFEVWVEDDDDEAPMGQPNDPARDNNLTLLMTSRCTNPAFAHHVADQLHGEVVQVRMVYIPGLSDHGSAPSGSNAM